MTRPALFGLLELKMLKRWSNGYKFRNFLIKIPQLEGKFSFMTGASVCRTGTNEISIIPLLFNTQTENFKDANCFGKSQAYSVHDMSCIWIFKLFYFYDQHCTHSTNSIVEHCSHCTNLSWLHFKFSTFAITKLNGTKVSARASPPSNNLLDQRD